VAMTEGMRQTINEMGREQHEREVAKHMKDYMCYSSQACRTHGLPTFGSPRTP